MFSTTKAPTNLKNLFDSELGLYKEAAGNAYDAAFKIAALNLEVLKQARAIWSAQSEQIRQMDGNAISPLLDMNQFKKNVEIAASYGQHLTKIMLDLQAEMLKMAQQQATQISSMNGSASETDDTSMANGNFPGIPIFQSMVEQASKGYADWNKNMLHFMDAVDSDLVHQAARKGTNHQAKPRSSK